MDKATLEQVSLRVLFFFLAIIILPMFHIHISLPLEVYDSADLATNTLRHHLSVSWGLCLQPGTWLIIFKYKL